MLKEYQEERFDVFIAGVMSCMQNIIDMNKYEDFCRSLLGTRSYLLFSLDRLFNTVSINLKIPENSKMVY